MIVKLKQPTGPHADLTPGQPYAVISIEADDWRILNDHGQPYLYPSEEFDVIDARWPHDWLLETGVDGEHYDYPPQLDRVGFFEDFFDDKEETIAAFWQVVNQCLTLEKQA